MARLNLSSLKMPKQCSWQTRLEVKTQRLNIAALDAPSFSHLLRESCYKVSLKQQEVHSQKGYMPVWSKEELVKHRAVLFSENSEAVEDAHACLGGSVRWLASCSPTAMERQTSPAKPKSWSEHTWNILILSTSCMTCWCIPRLTTWKAKDGRMQWAICYKFTQNGHSKNLFRSSFLQKSQRRFCVRNSVSRPSKSRNNSSRNFCARSPWGRWLERSSSLWF